MNFDSKFLFELGDSDRENININEFDIKKFLVKYIGNEEYVTLPEHIRGIGTGAFEGNIQIKNISISCSEPEFGIGAFRDAENLESIEWKECEYIPPGCFYGCKKLKKIGSTDEVLAIADSAFSGCKSLKQIYVSKKTQAIAPTAFSGSGIINIIIDKENPLYRYEDGFLIENVLDRITWVNNNIWKDYIVIPTGIRVIGEDAFDSFEVGSIHKILIPNSVTLIQVTGWKFHRVKIICVKDSHAHKYAEAYGYSYEFINE